MSYISAIRDRDEVRVWERNDGKRELKTFQAPYFFFTEYEDGEYTSIYGDKLTRHDFSTYGEMSQAKQECESNRVPMYESDIPPELKILSERYHDKLAPKLNITLLDIEVDYNREIGFSTVENPYAPVNSIAMYHSWENRMTVYAVPPESVPDKDDFIAEMNRIEKLPEDVTIDVVFCNNERELLLSFLGEIEESDVLSGWNSDFFDVPYLGKRILSVLGQKYFRMLSFPLANDPRWRKVEQFNVEREVLDISGRVTIDYLDLFRKYEVAERASYKLESIADEILPEMPKMKYEGSLADLYRKNFAYFVRYNLRDTEILRGFEKRLAYIELANQMYHISTGLMKHVTGTLKLAELAIINYCHELGLRVNDNEIQDESQGIQGAYVLEPKVGLHEMTGSIDVKSLYPSSIRSINISPETLIGQFKECERATEEIKKGSLVTLSLYVDGNDDPFEKTAEEWKAYLKKNKWAVSGYGTVFDQAKRGVIPAILETWYDSRKKMQKHKKDADAKSDAEHSAYYDRLQYVYKIKLNSLYGALNNRFFRFYDLRMGESTTGTGRMILRHMCSMVGRLLDDNYDVKADSVIYGDTDSVYFATHAKSKDEAVQIADSVAKRINASFKPFMQETFLCNDGYDSTIECNREIISDKGIFVDKKRYILHLVDLDGKPVDKLKVMGLDTKKTTLPSEVSKKLNNFIERFLKGEDWDVIARDIVDYKEELRSTPHLMTIGLPKGVKGVEDYTEQYKIYGEGVRLPGHVAASIFYNKCIQEYNDRDALPIVSGMKIKVFYLTEKSGRFKSIALPTDISSVPEWFTTHFSVDRDAHIERLVDNPLNNIVKAIGKETPSKQSLVVETLLDF